jgi:membrane-associated phospholipid phosphatase
MLCTGVGPQGSRIPQPRSKRLKSMHYPRLLVALFAALSLYLGVASPAVAQDVKPRLEWKSDWSPATWVDASVAVGLFAAGAGIQYGIGEVEDPHWEGPILGDEFFRENLLRDTVEDARDAAFASDILLFSLIGAPILIQPGIAWLGHDSTDVATQQVLMNVEALSVAFFTTVALKHAVGRERPPEGVCWDDPLSSPFSCERERLSFPSGHTSMSFAGAGLVCLNHEQFPLLGGGWWDRAACYTALGGATATGLLRIAANKHYFSDVFVGAAIGLAAGYLMPKWLFFGFGGDEDGDSDGVLSKVGATVMPQVSSEMKGMSLSITF